MLCRSCPAAGAPRTTPSPELVSLAQTASRWQDQIVCAVLAGVTTAGSESLNRLAKLEAGLACEFRNPASQQRRVRVACTRAARRPQDRARTVTEHGREP